MLPTGLAVCELARYYGYEARLHRDASLATVLVRLSPPSLLNYGLYTHYAQQPGGSRACRGSMKGSMLTIDTKTEIKKGTGANPKHAVAN